MESLNKNSVDQGLKSKGSPIRDAVINIALPSVILMKLSDPGALGPLWSFVAALSIPFAYGIYSAILERKLNWIAALGLFNILAAGALRYFEVGKVGFGIKEALTPFVIGLVVLFSLRAETPLVTKMLYNDSLLNVHAIDQILKERDGLPSLQKLLKQTTWLLAGSFFFSACMNFALAIWFLRSPIDSPEFNKELGSMTALSWPIIVVPSMAIMALSLWHLTSGIKRLTGLSWDNIFKTEGNKPL